MNMRQPCADKSESRISKSETNSKSAIRTEVLLRRVVSNFVLRICFGFRFSNFVFGGALLFMLLAAGCGGNSLKTYPVRGKVSLADGDVKLLRNGHVEFMLESDQTMRASGKIGPDGSFVVQTQHKGVLLTGAPAGAYKGRIILSDEYDEPAAKRPPRPVHKRFLDFKKSGLKLTVPTDGEITVTVSRL
jgi:hypothetical protein